MKFYIYGVVLIGIMILLTGAGVELPSVSLVKSLNIFNSTGDITFQNFQSSDLWTGDSGGEGNPTGLASLLFGLTASAIIIGIFTRSAPESWLVGGIVLTITTLLTADMLSIYLLLASGESWIKWVALAIFAPLTFGLYATAITFWKGGDG